MQRTSFSAALAVLLVSAPALGRDDAPTPDPLPEQTFAYTTPAEPKPLRALLELGAVFALGFTWYATSAPTVQHWDPGYRWSVFREKLVGTNVGTDANSFGTNFVGHPLGGTGYYLAARSNRLTILQSFGVAIASSLLWELLGEVSEVVSVNDMIVTPLAGLAIGEATIQLAAHFDRSSPSSTHRVLGAAFGPIKTMNDAFDGVTPLRAPEGASGSEWHRFHLEAAGTLARADPGDTTRDVWWPEVRFEASSEIIHLPGFAGSGHDARAFDDGNASNIALSATLGENGLTDFVFETHVVLAGGYYRASRRDADGDIWGGNGLVGVSSGFQYTLHQYRRDEGRAMDRIASVQPLGISFSQKGGLGGPVVATAVELGPDFGGVTPVSLRQFEGSASQLPVEQAARGYYFAVGGHARASGTLEHGPLNVDVELLAEAFEDVAAARHADAVSLADSLALFRASIGYKPARFGAMPRAFVERRVRAGRIGPARGSCAETTLGVGLGAVF